MKEQKKQRAVLTVDPGFAAFGYGVIAMPSHEVLVMGVARTKPSNAKVLKSDDALRRLREISSVLVGLAGTYKIVGVSMESQSLPKQTSKQNAVKIGYPYGVVAMFATWLDIPVVQLSPQAVKKELCDRQDASKEEVEQAAEALWSADPAVQIFRDNYPDGVHNHAWDALAAFAASRQTEVMRALRGV